MGTSAKTFYDPVPAIDIPDQIQPSGLPQFAKRNNNPGNLRFAGQPGAVLGEGGFAKFETPESGWAALQNQLKADQARGLKLGDFINKYAPPNENDTARYLKFLQSRLGVNSDTPINTLDTSELASAIAQHESGTRINLPPTQQTGGIPDAKSFYSGEAEAPKSFTEEVSTALHFLHGGIGTGEDASLNPSLQEATYTVVPTISKVVKRLGQLAVNMNPFGMTPDKAEEFVAPFVSAWQNKKATAKNLASGFVHMVVNSTPESILGVTERDGKWRPLTPEERAQATLDMLSLGVMGATAGITKAAIPATTGRLLRGAAEGITSGFAGGLVSTSDPVAAAAQAILFAPLGSAFEVIAGKPALKASEGAKLQQLRSIRPMGVTDLPTLANFIDGLKTADDVAEAALLGKINEPGPLVIPGVENPSRLVEKAILSGRGVVPQFFKRPDGTYDVGIFNNNNVRDAKTFSETGYLPGELVSVNGMDKAIAGIKSNGNMLVRDPHSSGGLIEVDPADIRRHADIKPEFVPVPLLYHGTPHEFDKFDLAKIGTGEGHQIRGYGFYFGEAPGTGEHYANNISPKKFVDKAYKVLNDAGIDPSDPSFDSYKDVTDALLSYPDFTPKEKAFIENMAKEDWLGYDRPMEAINDILTYDSYNLDQASPELRDSIGSLKRGNLLKVAIQDKIHKFLNLDTVLANQSELVKSVWRKLSQEQALMDTILGEDFYRELSMALGSDAAASARLRSEGILGNRFLDQFSRGDKPNPTYNYVAFDPADVIINGEPLRAELPPRGYMGYGIDPVKAKQSIVDDFFNYAYELEKENNPKSFLGFTGWNDLPSFTDIFNKFAKERGFSEREIPQLAADVSHALEKQYLLDEAIPTREQILQHYLDVAIDRAKKDIYRLRADASTNGLSVEEHTDGTIAIRHDLSNKIVGRFGSHEIPEAVDFVNKTGQEVGGDLSNGGAPPGFGHNWAPLPDQPEGPQNSAWTAKDSGALSKSVSSLNIMGDWITKAAKVFQSIDNVYGTSLHPLVFDKLRQARAMVINHAHPLITELIGISKIAKTKIDELDLLKQRMLTRSPEEIKAEINTNSSTPDYDIYLAEFLAQNKVDVARLLKQLATEHDIIEAGGKDFTAIDAAITKSREGFSQAELLNLHEIDRFSSSKGNLGDVIRLQQALIGKADETGGLTKQEFDFKNNLSPALIKKGEALEGFIKRLAVRAKVPEDLFLRNYEGYANALREGDLETSLTKDFPTLDKNSKDLLLELYKSNALDVAERNPEMMAKNLVHGVIDHETGFKNTLAEAVISAKAEMRKIRDAELAKNNDENLGATEDLSNYVASYMRDVQGFSRPIDKKINSAFQNFMSAISLGKIKVSNQAAKTLTDLSLLTVSSSSLGGRLKYGLSDIISGTGNHYVRFGALRTAKMIDYATRGYDSAMNQLLHEQGQLTTLNVINVDNPELFADTHVGRAINRLEKTIRATGDIGFKLTGQKPVYDLLAYGTYVEAWKNAGDILTKLSRGEYGQGVEAKIKAYDELKLQDFERTDQVEFDRLVSQDKISEASMYLARRSVDETIGTFGLGNNPRGWGTIPGRVLGQMGSWAVWYRGILTQALSQGTLKSRLGKAGRLAAFATGIYALQQESGINLSLVNPLKAFTFSGGPLLDIWRAGNDAIGSYGYPQKAAQDRFSRLGKMIIPGSYMAEDVIRAQAALEQGQPLPQVGAQLIGFHLLPPQ